MAPLWPQLSRVRFLNASYGYQPFRIYVNSRRVVNFLGPASISAYGRFLSGYQTVTVSGMDGYIYIQKAIPFEAGRTSTVAIINRAGGLVLIQIQDSCCPPSNGLPIFAVSNLAYNSGPMDVLLGDGRVIYADVRFKETTMYKRIQQGEYQFLFAETNLCLCLPGWILKVWILLLLAWYPIPDIVASLYLNVGNNTNYTVFLINNGPNANAIQTMVVADQSQS